MRARLVLSQKTIPSYFLIHLPARFSFVRHPVGPGFAAENRERREVPVPILLPPIDMRTIFEMTMIRI